MRRGFVADAHRDLVDRRWTLKQTARRDNRHPIGHGSVFLHNFAQTSYGVSVNFAGNDLAMGTPYDASFPRWKGNTTLGWNLHDIDVALTYRYSGPYAEEIVGTPPRIPSVGLFDLNVEYCGVQKLTVYGRVNNLFDRYPPFDPIFLNFPGQPPYDPSLYNDEGRYVEVGLKYKFF